MFSICQMTFMRCLTVYSKTIQPASARTDVLPVSMYASLFPSVVSASQNRDPANDTCCFAISADEFCKV
jgi:hypothetical protein